MRVLIVEDDPLLGAGLATGLRQDGFTADWLGAAEPALHALQLEHVDLLVLDLRLPGRDGLWLLRELRRLGLGLPVLILSARDETADKVAGLDAGADDYLAKPCDLDELGARLRALARRAAGTSAPVLRVGALALDRVARIATLGGQPLALSPREYALLEALSLGGGQPVPRARLEASLYGWTGDPDSNSLEVHVYNLRRKLGRDVIRTIRGLGYALEPPR